MASVEQRIAEAEARLQARRAALEDPAIASDGPRLLAASAELDEAQKIVRYRDDHGPFADFDALAKVPGVDAKKLEKNRDAITF